MKRFISNMLISVFLLNLIFFMDGTTINKIWADTNNSVATPTASENLKTYDSSINEKSEQVEASEDTTPPIRTAAAIKGTAIILTYDEDLDPESVPDLKDFTIKVNKVEEPGLRTRSAIKGNEAIITMTQAIPPKDTVTLSYKPGTSPIQDIAGNEALGFKDITLENRTPSGDTTPPIRTLAAIKGTAIVLTYDEALDPESVPHLNDFTIKVNQVEELGLRTGSAIKGNEAIITMTRAIPSEDVVTLSYRPDVPPIQDKSGNKAAGFTDIKIMHLEKTINYEYDDDNRLRYIRMHTGEVFEYEYDVKGNLIRCLKH